MASTSGGGHGGKRRNLVEKGILEKKSTASTRLGKDVIKGTENVYAVNEAFFAFDLFTILPSLQVIHCGKNTVQENEIYSDSNKCYRNTRESQPAACFEPPWNRVKCLSVQFGGSVLISKSSFADKPTVP